MGNGCGLAGLWCCRAVQVKFRGGLGGFWGRFRNFGNGCGVICAPFGGFQAVSAHIPAVGLGFEEHCAVLLQLGLLLLRFEANFDFALFSLYFIVCRLARRGARHKSEQFA